MDEELQEEFLKIMHDEACPIHGQDGLLDQLEKAEAVSKAENTLAALGFTFPTQDEIAIFGYEKKEG